MKAVVLGEHGGPDKLKYADAPEPVIRANEVLVEVRACALNHLDVWARLGLPGVKLPLPLILGNDVSGVIAATGELVDWVRPGDEVMLQPGVSCGHCIECLRGQDHLCPAYKVIGYMRDGGYAEFVAAPAANVIRKPESISFEEAAALPLVTLTVWHMLVARANVQPGEDVLVHAAGSGVGSVAIQVAKLRGALVIATAGSDEKLARARELGADEVVNYSDSNWTREVRRLTAGRGCDVIVEHTGADTWHGSVTCLKSNGRLVTCGATSGHEAKTDLRHVFYRHLSLLGSYMGSKADLLEAMKFIERGQIRAVVDRVLPLFEAHRAHELMENRAQFGKLVLVPNA